jgi:hypothetical protein
MKFVRFEVFTILLITLVALSNQNLAKSEAQCHPQCSWKCDDPHCPAICDPVCEPPKCHTSCAEPKNAICDVKCEKPECEIKCPDKGCEMYDCPKCVTVCKQPHCVTHCQAPKPECEAVCEEPRCDWKCTKPQCPKPKCELVCENPNCVPKVECCPCTQGVPRVSTPFPFFKETESNQGCCGCDNKNSAQPQQMRFAEKDLNPNISTVSETRINDLGTHVVKSRVTSTVESFSTPKPIGTSYYTHPTQEINKFNAERKLSIN